MRVIETARSTLFNLKKGEKMYIVLAAILGFIWLMVKCAMDDRE